MQHLNLPLYVMAMATFASLNHRLRQMLLNMYSDDVGSFAVRRRQMALRQQRGWHQLAAITSSTFNTSMMLPLFSLKTLFLVVGGGATVVSAKYRSDGCAGTKKNYTSMPYFTGAPAAPTLSRK